MTPIQIKSKPFQQRLVRPLPDLIDISSAVSEVKHTISFMRIQLVKLMKRWYNNNGNGVTLRTTALWVVPPYC
jgi:hypothetical protein